MVISGKRKNKGCVPTTTSTRRPLVTKTLVFAGATRSKPAGPGRVVWADSGQSAKVLFPHFDFFFLGPLAAVQDSSSGPVAAALATAPASMDITFMKRRDSSRDVPCTGRLQPMQRRPGARLAKCSRSHCRWKRLAISSNSRLCCHCKVILCGYCCFFFVSTQR